jgi:hypothetical protein
MFKTYRLRGGNQDIPTADTATQNTVALLDELAEKETAIAEEKKIIVETLEKQKTSLEAKKQEIDDTVNTVKATEKLKENNFANIVFYHVVSACKLLDLLSDSSNFLSSIISGTFGDQDNMKGIYMAVTDKHKAYKVARDLMDTDPVGSIIVRFKTHNNVKGIRGIVDGTSKDTKIKGLKELVDNAKQAKADIIVYSYSNNTDTKDRSIVLNWDPNSIVDLKICTNCSVDEIKNIFNNSNDKLCTILVCLRKQMDELIKWVPIEKINNIFIQSAEQPTVQPAEQSTVQPTIQPTVQPTIQPAEQPTVQPAEQPTVQPDTTQKGGYNIFKTKYLKYKMKYLKLYNSLH